MKARFFLKRHFRLAARNQKPLPRPVFVLSCMSFMHEKWFNGK